MNEPSDPCEDFREIPGVGAPCGLCGVTHWCSKEKLMRNEVAPRLPDMWRDEFLAVREIPGLGLCAVQRFIYTCGLLVNVRIDGLIYNYDARYCYPIERDALRDLRNWDGKGDPPGDWIKEKVSERAKGSEP